MPMFVFISGYFFKSGGNTFQEYFKFFKKKFKKLIIPFFGGGVCVWPANLSLCLHTGTILMRDRDGFRTREYIYKISNANARYKSSNLQG